MNVSYTNLSLISSCTKIVFRCWRHSCELVQSFRLRDALVWLTPCGCTVWRETSCVGEVRFAFHFRFRMCTVVIHMNHIYFTIKLHTERHGRAVNTPASYSGGPGSNLGLETGYPDRDVSWLYSVPPGKFRDNTLHRPRLLASVLSNSSFTYHTFIRRYIVWVTETASLNNYK
jgi:hypothetical protein